MVAGSSAPDPELKLLIGIGRRRQRNQTLAALAKLRGDGKDYEKKAAQEAAGRKESSDEEFLLDLLLQQETKENLDIRGARPRQQTGSLSAA